MRLTRRGETVAAVAFLLALVAAMTLPWGIA